MKKRGDSFVRNKINNNGSTLIVVLVAVSFLVVLASIIITVSSANLRMKQIEYAMKRNFYIDEAGLEDIYSGVGRDVSKLLSTAYSKTLLRANEGSYKSQKDAYMAFAAFFRSDLETLYGKQTNAENADADTEMARTLSTLNNYISREAETSENLQVESFGGIEITNDTETGANMRQYIIKAVKIRYMKDNKYESVITTDIVIEIPYINFFQDFTEVLEYSLIGNKGVYFTQSGFVMGNVYAGIDEKEKNASYDGYKYSSNNVYDGINFYQANVTFDNSSYIISRGDFNICDSSVEIKSEISDSTNEAQTNLWVENIRIVENGKSFSSISSAVASPSPKLPHLKAAANIYSADDLELNAKGSKVTLSGNYYGYNFNGSNSESSYKTYESRNLKDIYSSAASHTTSSSIIINGNNSTLDLTGLNTLMVAGVAYLDIKNDASYSDMAKGTAKASEYRTGESIAMRSNQFLYLAPNDILNDGISNPQKNGSTEVSEVYSEEKLEKWFGQGYLMTEKPVIPVVYVDNGSRYTYYFLNLLPGLEENYVTEIMSANAPGETATEAVRQKWKLKQEISSKMNSTSISAQISVNESEGSGVKIYTAGLLTDDGQTGKKNNISLDNMAARSANFQKHYMQLYVNLDPNSLDTVTDGKRDSTEYPLATFLDMSKFLAEKLPNKKLEVEDVEDANVWLYGNDVTIDVSTNDAKGIILCKGDLTITGNGGSFEGLIASAGKITVEGTVDIKSNSGIVQAILEAEQRKVTEAEEDELKEIKLEEYASNYFLYTALVELTDLTKDNLIDVSTRITSTEYMDYIYYDNWRRGEIFVTE